MELKKIKIYTIEEKAKEDNFICRDCDCACVNEEVSDNFKLFIDC